MILRPENAGEITIPIALAESSLTLEEIGALVCLSSFQKACGGGDISHEMASRFETEEFTTAIKALKSRGIVTMEFVGDTLSFTINLEAASE